MGKKTDFYFMFSKKSSRWIFNCWCSNIKISLLFSHRLYPNCELGQYTLFYKSKRVLLTITPSVCLEYAVQSKNITHLLTWSELKNFCISHRTTFLLQKANNDTSVFSSKIFSFSSKYCWCFLSLRSTIWFPVWCTRGALQFCGGLFCSNITVALWADSGMHHFTSSIFRKIDHC